jgi:hypothetical protein
LTVKPESETPNIYGAAKVPFVRRLAREFGLSVGHTWKVLAGVRASPSRGRMIARQNELLRAQKELSKKAESP